jgi:hypothetical protein
MRLQAQLRAEIRAAYATQTPAGPVSLYRGSVLYIRSFQKITKTRLLVKGSHVFFRGFGDKKNNGPGFSEKKRNRRKNGTKNVPGA